MELSAVTRKNDPKTNESQARRPDFPHNIELKGYAVDSAVIVQPKDIPRLITRLEYSARTAKSDTTGETRHTQSSSLERRTCDVCGRVLKTEHARYSHYAKSHRMRKKHSRL